VFSFTVKVSNSNDDENSNNGINTKVKQSLYRPVEGLQETEAPRFNDHRYMNVVRRAMCA
jgi:hypothetical protein